MKKKQFYDHRTGERLPPHVVKTGQLSESEAMTKHRLFERVSISLLVKNGVRCKWLDEVKHGPDGPLVQSRLAATEIAHEYRFDTFADTAPHKCIQTIISRAASSKNRKVL